MRDFDKFYVLHGNTYTLTITGFYSRVSQFYLLSAIGGILLLSLCCVFEDYQACVILCSGKSGNT